MSNSTSTITLIVLLSVKFFSLYYWWGDVFLSQRWVGVFTGGFEGEEIFIV
ncbi:MULTISPECIES: hypothetical protein [Chryseobacterium]|uniref:hypothetical protein n=1 Tax=Chryseobacterium TaxID=59732 RepID=UPI0013EF35E5|nr:MULTISPECIES: hypothetical protein [Chryseobacterium]QQV03757.1 hypothetical protein I6I61_05320 [Chryseobacterium sp. FDAARGOS 1104]